MQLSRIGSVAQGGDRGGGPEKRQERDAFGAGPARRDFRALAQQKTVMDDDHPANISTTIVSKKR